MLGWIPIEIFPTDEGINNPIPMRVQMRKDGKQFIAHWVDDYRRSMCGKVKLYTRMVDHAGQNTGIQDIDKIPTGPSSWRSFAVPCPECYEKWKVRPKDEV